MTNSYRTNRYSVKTRTKGSLDRTNQEHKLIKFVICKIIFFIFQKKTNIKINSQ